MYPSLTGANARESENRMSDRSIVVCEEVVGEPFIDTGSSLVSDVIETSVIYVKGRGNMLECRVIKRGDIFRSFALIGGICEQTYLDRAKRFSRKRLNEYADSLKGSDQVTQMTERARADLQSRKAEGKMY